MTAEATNGNPPPPTGLVAVIGLGSVMPDANNVQEFWANIKAGKSSIREIPKERWDPVLYYSLDRTAPDKTYSKIGSFVTGFQFDAKKFRIPPNVVKSLDDSQLWALESAHQALASAGYDTKEFDRTRCAVILGNAMGGEQRVATSIRLAWPMFRKALEETPEFGRLPSEDQARVLVEAERRFKGRLPEITEDTMPGELSNVIAGRIANLLNLSGKNFTTDAACASSLAAIDAACKALLYRDCDLVLTGGVDRSQDVGSFIKFCKIGALSATGSFPFDARADGFIMGEGCALFLLKRYEDAVRDGDKIYAVIRGVGASSDGKGKGITAPNIEGQLKCLQRALVDGQIPPGEVDLVECHGTSTRVGDVVELQGLLQVFGPHVSKKQSIPIGSVKSNVGHLKSAAGAASLLKVILALHEQVIPPSINYETPNPNIKIEETPFYVNTKTQPWPEPPAGRPRRVGISSFGFGGTNFHVLLEEYAPGKNHPKTSTPILSQSSPTLPPVKPVSPIASVLLQSTPRHRTTEPLAKTGHTDVLVVGAATSAALEGELQRVQHLLTTRVTPRNFPVFLYTQNLAALSRDARVALVVESPQDAAEKLVQAAEGLRDAKKRPLLANKGIHFGEGRQYGKVAFLFPGQGSQYADMLRDLATRFETVKRTIEDADRVMTPLVGKPLTELMFLDEARGVTREQAEESLKRTEITQPAVLAADLALYRLLADYGVKPDMVAGHSLGEYGALVAAGVLTFEDALLAVSARGREMANVHVPDLGKMASVSADPATVEVKLKQIQGYVIPANKNCRVQTVIAGNSAAVDAAVKMFNEQGIQAQLIPVSAAFHSSIVAPAKDPLRRVVERLDIREPKIPLLSNVHADYYPRGPGAREAALDLLAQQVAAPVEWQRQVQRMHQDGARIFVEVGPKATLTTFAKNILEGQPYAAVATNHPKRGGFYHYFDTIALLAAVGYPLRFPKPEDPHVHLAAYRETTDPYAETTPNPAPVPVAPAAPTPMATASVTTLAFPNLQQAADDFIRQKQEELRRVLHDQLQALRPAVPASPSTAPVADGELVALKKRVEALGLNLEPVLITGVSVGTPGSHKKLFDDANFERLLRGENSIDVLTPEEQRRQLEKNIVRLVKSETGDHRFDLIQDTAEVIKLAAKRGQFDFEKDYGINPDFAQALDITSKIAIAAGIEALRDAQIPLVRGYVKTTTGKFLPGEWALPEPLQQETGVIFASVWPGVPKIVDYVSQAVAHQYAQRGTEERKALYRDLVALVRDPESRARLEAWYHDHQRDLEGDSEAVFKFNRRFLFHVLSMGHSQLAQFIRAKGPNTQINAACSTTTQGIAIAEDWIRTGRCKRVLIVGADDITGPEMLEYWASGFLAAGAATTEGDVTKAALPFDKRRHGMIIGMGAVGIVVEAESVVKERGMEGITEILATTTLNSAYHGSRLDTEHVAMVMDDLVATVERRTGTPRSVIADRLLFMSHETYTPARGGSAAAEIEALSKTFGPDVSKVVVANTKGFTGHPMGVGIEDAIAMRCLQTGRAPPIANLREPDPSLGNIQLSRGAAYDLEYGLRLGAGFGSQIAMYVVKLRSKDVKRIVDATKYHAWLSTVSGTRNPELEVVHRTLRVKAQLPPLAETTSKPSPPLAPPPPATPSPLAPPVPRPVPVVAASPAPTHSHVLQRVLDLVADKTGYPKEMLEPDLDLEADLGIDTVKQAELFGLLRESYRLPREENLQLKDYPTLNKIAGYIVSRATGSFAMATTLPAAAVAPLVAPSSPSGVTREQILQRLLALVAEKTGYPPDMLEPDLDLEADLGIDTVKQAELFGLLRESYHLPRDDTIQLKDYPTLNKISDYLHGRLTSTPSGTPPASLIEAAPTPSSPPILVPSPRSGNKLQILAHVRQVVADKTGYPLDMLEPELDLEADLGIDTVKQAELFGLLRESYGIARVEGIQLKDYNTLSKLADFLLQQQAAPAPPPPPREPVPAVPTPLAPSVITERKTHRYVVRYVNAPGAAVDAHALEGRTLIVWAPPRHRADLVHALKKTGAVGVPLEALPTRLEEAVAWVEAQRRKTPRINGILFVPTPQPQGSAYTRDDLHVPKAFFYLLKAILAGAKSGEVEFVATATFLGGDFAAHATDPINPLDGALVGLAKAVARELPGITVKAVDFAPATPPPTLAQVFTEELGRHDGLVEVGTLSGRGTLRLLEQETVEEEPGVEWSAQDVLLVSGGVSGITSPIVRRLAQGVPATFILLGRTSLHPEAARFARFTVQEWNGQRVELQAELKAKGEKATPVAVEKRLSQLQKSAEIHTTLEAIRALGTRVEYHAVDVTDPAAVARVVQHVRKAYGPVTGLLHAAGVEESKLLVDKTPESFDRVFDVKVLGARNLLEATEGDRLRFFVAFTSVAGRFGNAGQADYSAANDTLAKLCAALRLERGGTFPATAIDWSAWDEKGMATRGSVMTVLKEAGVTPIPLAEGVERFVQEFAHGLKDNEILIAGELGRLAPGDAFTTSAQIVVVPTHPQPRSIATSAPTNGATRSLLVVEEAPHGNLVTQVGDSDGRTLTATLRLDPAQDPYLRDHAVDGTPYLPGVFGLEAFVEVASRLAPGKLFTGARDVEYSLPVKVLRNRPIEVTIVASVAHESDRGVEIGCRLQSIFVNPKGERVGAPRIHFTGTLVFEAARGEPPEAPLLPDLESVVEQPEIYRHFFHGPSFQVLGRLSFAEGGNPAIGLWADPRAPLLGDREARFLTNPMMRELAYQTAGAYELFRHQFLALPKGVRRLRFYGTAAPNEAVRAFARFKETRDAVTRFDVILATAEGRVLEELEDFELIRTRPLEPPNGPASGVSTSLAPTSPVSVYKARWGHDLPIPAAGVRGVLVRQQDIDGMGVTAGEALTSGERADGERYQNPKRATEFFLGRLAAKEAIARLLDRPVTEARGIEVRRLETGEPVPRGKGLENLLVSITHTGAFALAAAAHKGPLVTIGIDAERIEEKPGAFESESFTEAERKLVRDLVKQGRDHGEIQVLLWSVKEAVLKALGKGFALDLHDVRIAALNEENAIVDLAEPAQTCLKSLGATNLRVQTWLRDGYAYAFAWTTR